MDKILDGNALIIGKIVIKVDSDKDGTWTPPPKTSKTPLLLNGIICELFPNYCPVNQIGNKEPIDALCVIDSCMHIFVYLVKKDENMNLFNALAKNAMGAAIPLLQCILEGRGVSAEADALRYVIAMDPRRSSLQYTLNLFGFQTAAIHEKKCTHCGATHATGNSNVCLSLEDLILLNNPSTYQDEVINCNECGAKAPVTTVMKLNPYGFCANVRESPPSMIKNIHVVIPQNITVGCIEYSLILLVAAFPVKHPVKTRYFHFINLIVRAGDATFLEMCDMEPTHLSRALTDTVKENRLIQPVVAIYKCKILQSMQNIN